MRIIAGLAVGIAVLALGSGAALAQTDEPPWCTEFDPFTKNCAFATYGECAAAARSAGVTCVRNPRYQPPATAAAEPSRGPAHPAAKPRR